MYVCVCVCTHMHACACACVCTHMHESKSMELGPEHVSLLERCPHFRGWLQHVLVTYTVPGLE